MLAFSFVEILVAIEINKEFPENSSNFGEAYLELPVKDLFAVR